ncbi:MAG: 5-carboxymethyl-2-hydroxymuconate Delta-isomerase [Stenotrophomonas sp.]|uniref:5-carboxymethyl-2-hydroxymuconate Delta-isomerase n=1 Tax=Stenotrophomonas sp. TaxID=69392 RepID=UPI003D6D002C
MPHLTLEYSNNLATAITPAVLRAANQALMRTGQFQEMDIKTRAIGFDLFAIGTADTARGFVTAKLSILSGRSAETKREIAQTLLAALETAIPADGWELQTSVEILDIDRDSYAKSLRNG